jgi:membrane-associated PAP2 superfamily phosphatase
MLAAALFAFTPVDIQIAHALFFDAEGMRWMGTGSWWANELFHVGGSRLMRAVGAAAVALLIASWFSPALRAWRRPTIYFIVACTLSVGVVGLLKQLTNIDCPWDLQPFGGRYPVVGLLADRPDELRPGRCFPAAHASSGYALLALYFALRERSAVWARRALGIGLTIGLIFGIAQQSRGAHFVSHDLWSAFIAWITSLTLYTVAFKARLWDPDRPQPRGPAEHEKNNIDVGQLRARRSAAVPSSRRATARAAGEHSAR